MEFFINWLKSTYQGQVMPVSEWLWKGLHLWTFISCVLVIVLLALIFRKKSVHSKRMVIIILASFILFFELARRVINLTWKFDGSLPNLLSIILARPWCAISCWLIIFAVIFNKKTLYNVASVSALLCAVLFFIYPGVGFKMEIMQFEATYSISTHSLLFVTSITFMTLKFCDFSYKNFLKYILFFSGIFAYAFFEIFILKIEDDPMYFMPNGEIRDILGMSYTSYIILYIIFLILYFNIFFIIYDRKNVKAFCKNIFLKKKNIIV